MTQKIFFREILRHKSGRWGGKEKDLLQNDLTQRRSGLDKSLARLDDYEREQRLESTPNLIVAGTNK